MNLKQFKAFSLGEILISMAIIGVISAMMIASISKATPDRKKVMFLKGYHALELAVAETINDPTKYDMDLYSDADGGSNFDFSDDPKSDATSSSCGNLEQANAVCCFVADHFNIVGVVNCGAGVEKNFQTSNGVCYGYMGGHGDMTIDPLCDGKNRIVVNIAADGRMTVPTSSSSGSGFEGYSGELQAKAARWMTEQTKLGDEEPD